MSNPMDQLGKQIEEQVGLDSTGRRERIDIMKVAMREVINEWMDQRLKDFGRWSLYGLAITAFGALVYFVLTHSGWTRQ